MRAARTFVGLVLLSMALCAPGVARADARITWQVDNPFRFFVDPADTEVHRATYLALGSGARRSPVLSSEEALERRVDDGWAAATYKKTCWDTKRNRFHCAAYDDYINPTKHRIVAHIEGVDDASMLSCTWLTAPDGGSTARGKAVTQACGDRFVFDAPYPGGAKVSVEIGGRLVAEEDIKVRDLLIAGMGDSFASGEGNPDVPVRFSRERAADYGGEDYLKGYPARMGPWTQIGDKAFIKENARWLDQACHRSLYSHQLRAALQLAIEDPHRAVTYVGVACSGAEVTFGLFLRYKGNEWVPNPPEFSQISAVAEAQCGNRPAEPLDLPEAYHINGRIPELKGGLVLRKCPRDEARKIDLVFLSIGGNDVGFSRLLANTILSNESTLRMLGGWIGEVYGMQQASKQLVMLEARYKSLNRAFHNLFYIPWDESDRVILTGYPGLALEGDGSETCKDGRAGLEVVSDFRLSAQKLKEGTWIADKLNRLMRASAASYGWTFAETHRRQFIDRSICAGSVSDADTIADDLRLPRRVDGQWVPYNPADYKAYTPRRRWFRTPNDAFMTGNFHVAASLLQKVMKLDALASFQLLLASTYSGAFHPTAEGQAAIADAVVDKARMVLKKYGQDAAATPVEIDAPLPAPVPEPDVPLPDVKLPLTPEVTPDTPAAAQPDTPAAAQPEASPGVAAGSSDAAPVAPPAPSSGVLAAPVENGGSQGATPDRDPVPASSTWQATPVETPDATGNAASDSGVAPVAPIAPPDEASKAAPEVVAPDGVPRYAPAVPESGGGAGQ